MRLLTITSLLALLLSNVMARHSKCTHKLKHSQDEIWASLTQCRRTNFTSAYLDKSLGEENVPRINELHVTGMITTARSTIQPKTFVNMKSLRKFSSYNIDLASDAKFEGLAGLKYLEITHGRITSFTRETFKHLTNLEELYLDANHISAIPSGAFAGLSNIKVLSLSENDISVINTTDFKLLRKLTVLRLTDNRISSIVGIFVLPNLEVLEFAHNSLKRIDGNFFKDLTKLNFIDFRENNLDNKTGFLKGLNKLNAFLSDDYCLIRKEYLNYYYYPENMKPVLNHSFGKQYLYYAKGK